MQIAEETWSLGVRFGLPIAAFLLVLFLGVTLLALMLRPGASSYDKGSYTFFAWAGIVCAIITTGATFWAMYPLEREYHRWYPVAGEVEQVERRILSGGSSISERVLIEIAGKGQYGCDDTRCTGLKAGDQVSLHCKLEWQYTGTDGYSCNYIDSEQNNK